MVCLYIEMIYDLSPLSERSPNYWKKSGQALCEAEVFVRFTCFNTSAQLARISYMHWWLICTFMVITSITFHIFIIHTYLCFEILSLRFSCTHIHNISQQWWLNEPFHGGFYRFTRNIIYLCKIFQNTKHILMPGTTKTSDRLQSRECQVLGPEMLDFWSESVAVLGMNSLQKRWSSTNILEQHQNGRIRLSS